MNPLHTIYKQLLLPRDNVCCFLLSSSWGSRPFSPSRHSGAGNENHVLLDVVTSCLPKGAWTSARGGGLSSTRAQPPAPRGGCQHSMARRSWQQCEPPPLLPQSTSPCHFLPHVQQRVCFPMFSKQARTMDVCVSFDLSHRLTAAKTPQCLLLPRQSKAPCWHDQHHASFTTVDFLNLGK